jgi:sulfotransferase
MKEMIKEIIREEMMRASMKKYYFMAGLPRSGSTLLSAIFNQNPNVHSGPSSPVVGTMLTIENSLSNDELFLAYPKPEQAAKMISSVIENYYSDVDKNIIIDKNRSWVNRLHYIPGYFGVEPKVICPVRNMDEILASFISMHRRNPMASNGKINFMDEMLIKNNLPLTDENRCMVLSNPEFGIVGQSYNAIRQAIMEGKGKLLHFVEYDDLLNQPDETMRKIYEFLGEEYYQHDFSKIENIHKERDAEVYGLADMHDVRENLNKISGNPKEILPETVYEACQGTEFWRNMNDEFEESSESTEENLQEHNIFEDNSKEDEDKKIIGG